MFAGLSGVAAAGILVLRLLDDGVRSVWIFWGAALVVAAVAGAVAIARRPFTFTEALARLDDVARLHNRLVSAQAGVGLWPAPAPRAKDAAPWNWPRLLLPVMIAALLLTAVSLVEPPTRRADRRPSDEPAAWSQVASWLKTLEQAKLADPQALQKLKEQVDDLRRQSPEDWYAQNSLEAGDALRKEVEQGLREMQSALQQSSDSVAEAARQGPGMPSSELNALSASLRESIQALQSGNLPADKDLLGKLQAANLAHMTPQEMQALQQRLGEGLKTCSQCVSPRLSPGLGTGSSRRAGRSGPHGNNPNAKGTWSGGPGGGGSTAPMDLDENAANLGSRRRETVTDEDRSRALPGDVLGVTKGAHQVDKTAPNGPSAAGGLSSAGSGGDAVWRDSLTPDEGQVLQRYFK